MPKLYCACCGRPFARASSRGPVPLYCSRDCRVQMATRRRAWTLVERDGALWDRMRSEWTRTDAGASRSAGLSGLR
ncbi:hypothetical protein SAMN02982994_4223 [Azospirillum lipoferum]|nr:hypothetical protein SAMN02982994_4223 [Azospirillum lipoferum]